MRDSVHGVAVVLVLLTSLVWTVGVCARPVAQFDLATIDVSKVVGPATGALPGEALRTFDFLFSDVTFSAGSTDTLLSGPDSFGYVNLVDIDSNRWLVRDLPIPMVEEFLLRDPIFEHHAWFYSGDEPVGISAAIVNDVPFGALPVPDDRWTFFSPTRTQGDWGSDDPQGQEGDGSGVAPGQDPPQNPTVIEGYLRGRVPDIRQFRNECGPTSTTNSLLWLVQKHDLSTDRLTKTPQGDVDTDAFLKQMAQAMSPDWVEIPVQDNNRGYDGLNDNELHNGKEKFIKDKKLPISVKGGNKVADAKGKQMFDFIKSELKAGEDVEFLLDWSAPGSHWVTAVGYIDDPNGSNTLVVHDPVSAKGGNHYWKLDDEGNFSDPNGTALWAVSESVERDKIIDTTSTGSVDQTRGQGTGLVLETAYNEVAAHEIFYAYDELASSVNVDDLIVNQSGTAWTRFSVELDGADFFGSSSGLLAPEIDPVDPAGLPGDALLDLLVASGDVTLAGSRIERDGQGARLWIAFADPVDPGESFELLFKAGDVGLVDQAFVMTGFANNIPEPAIAALLAFAVVLTGWRPGPCRFTGLCLPSNAAEPAVGGFAPDRQRPSSSKEIAGKLDALATKEMQT